jgi:hypothetical protein
VALELWDAERSGAREEFVNGILAAMAAPSLAAGVAFGEAAVRDRDWLYESLRALATSFVREARRRAKSEPQQASLAARRHELVLDAIDAIERNGQAGLVLTGLVASLRHGRQLRPGTPPPIPVVRR